MKKCKCGKTIGDQYEECMECHKKSKEENTGDDPLIRAIGALNNNLYALRVIAEYDLRLKGKILVWVKGNPDGTTTKDKAGYFEVQPR